MIDKLYYLTGVQPYKHSDIEDGKNPKFFEEHYPSLSLEKQLKLIKFLLQKGVYYDTDGDTYWFHYTDEIENAKYRSFDEAIAECICNMWDTLSQKDKDMIEITLCSWSS